MDAVMECGGEVRVRIFIPRKTCKTVQPKCPGVLRGFPLGRLMYRPFVSRSHVYAWLSYRPATTRASTSAATAPSVVWAALKPSRKSASEKLA